jgi:hypothetical protein
MRVNYVEFFFNRTMKKIIFESQERILYEFIGLNILTRTLNFCDVDMLCGTYSKLILLIVISAKYI